MKTVFRIVADTKAMTATVHQANKLMWTKRYPSISDALLDMLNGIAAVQQRNAEEATKEITLS